MLRDQKSVSKFKKPKKTIPVSDALIICRKNKDEHMEGRKDRAIPTFDFGEFEGAVDKKLISVATGTDICVQNEPTRTVRHLMVFNDGKNGTSSFIVRLPTLRCRRIFRHNPYPFPSEMVQYFIMIEIYPNWPKGANRGEDPAGDRLLDFLTALEKRYVDVMNGDIATRDFIIAHFGDAADRDEDTSTRIDSIVRYPKHTSDKDGLIGQIDHSKSPYFKIELWNGRISKDAPQMGNFFIIDESKMEPADASDRNECVMSSQYTKVCYTKICDMRNGANKIVNDEQSFSEFIYAKKNSTMGDDEKNWMLTQMDIFTPLWIWSRGRAKMVLKAVRINTCGL